MNLIKAITSFVIIIFLVGCNRPPNDEIVITKVLNCSFNEMDYDYPYLYVAAWRDGLWKIDLSNGNYTTTYIPVIDSIESINEIDDVTAEGNDIIISTQTGIWRSEDAGTNWTNIGNYTLMGIERFIGRPGNIIYDKYYSSVVYFSDNYGTSWDSTQTGVQSADSYIVINPCVDGEAWIYGVRGGTGFGTPYLFCMDSCGRHLKLEVDMQNDLHCEDGLNHVNSITFDTTNPEDVFLCITNGRNSIYKSNDWGYNWQEISTDTLQIYEMCQNWLSHDKFYAICTNNKLYCVTDDFQTFELLGEISYEPGEGPIEVFHNSANNTLIIGETNGIQVIELNQSE